mgnify:CR=1 FL=1|jgi:uncharacterized membrane protein YfcA
MVLTLKQIGFVSVLAGVTSSVGVIIGIMAKPGYENPDWRDIAFMSALGGMLGSRYGMKGIHDKY